MTNLDKMRGRRHFLERATKRNEAVRYFLADILNLCFKENSFDVVIFSGSLYHFRDINPPFYSSFGRSENERFFSGQEVKAILQQEGFRDIYINALSGIPFKYVTSGIIRCLLPFYNFVDTLLGKVRWSKSFGAFLVVSAIK